VNSWSLRYILFWLDSESGCPFRCCRPMFNASALYAKQCPKKIIP
jgi:hypothetical protein